MFENNVTKNSENIPSLKYHFSLRQDYKRSQSVNKLIRNASKKKNTCELILEQYKTWIFEPLDSFWQRKVLKMLENGIRKIYNTFTSCCLEIWIKFGGIDGKGTKRGNRIYRFRFLFFRLRTTGSSWIIQPRTLLTERKLESITFRYDVGHRFVSKNSLFRPGPTVAECAAAKFDYISELKQLLVNYGKSVRTTRRAELLFQTVRWRILVHPERAI